MFKNCLYSSRFFGTMVPNEPQFNAEHHGEITMGKNRHQMTGGIRQKIFGMLLITIVLIIAAYTAVFFFFLF